MTTQNQALETKKQSALTIPEYLREFAGQGSEDGDKDDIVHPRLALAQSGHAEVKKSSGKKIEGLEEGEFFNTLTKKTYGEKVTVVPIAFFKNYIHWKSQDEGGGIIAMYQTKAEVPAGQLDFGQDEEGNQTKPVVMEYRNFLCVLPDHDDDLVVVSLKSTATKVAKQWYTLTRFGGAPIFAKRYELQSVAESRGGNDFFGLSVTPKGFNSRENAEQYAVLRQAFGANVKFDIEKPDEEGDESFDTTKSEM
jgi:hypothetical protein